MCPEQDSHRRGRQKSVIRRLLYLQATTTWWFKSCWICNFYCHKRVLNGIWTTVLRYSSYEADALSTKPPLPDTRNLVCIYKMYFSILILSYFTKRLANHGLVECSTVSYLSFWMGLLCIMVKGPYYYVLLICHVTICHLVTSAINIKFTIKLTLPFLNAVSKT